MYETVIAIVCIYVLWCLLSYLSKSWYSGDWSLPSPSDVWYIINQPFSFLNRIRYHLGRSLYSLNKIEDELNRIFPVLDKNRDKYDSRSQYPRFFTRELKARFPKEHIYFVPPYLRRAYNLVETDARFGEHFPERYKDFLVSFPHDPQTSAEQDSGEALFWKAYVDKFSRTAPDGSSSLAPDHEIFDHFSFSEKWIVREYYAASRRVIKSSVEEHSRLALDIKRYSEKFYHDRNSRIDCEKLLKQFQEYRLPQYQQEMGGWFIHTIKENFKKLHSQPIGTPTKQQRTHKPTEDEHYVF